MLMPEGIPRGKTELHKSHLHVLRTDGSAPTSKHPRPHRMLQRQWLKRFVDLVIALPFASDRAVRDDANAPIADYIITCVELVASLSRGVSEESMSKDL